jgi:hypothetical protein
MRALSFLTRCREGMQNPRVRGVRQIDMDSRFGRPSGRPQGEGQEPRINLSLFCLRINRQCEGSCSFLCVPKETNQRKGTRHLPALRGPSATPENGRDEAASSHFRPCFGSQLNGNQNLHLTSHPSAFTSHRLCGSIPAYEAHQTNFCSAGDAISACRLR